MMVVTRAQTGSDGPVTPTANPAASVHSNPNVVIPPEAGSAGRGGEHATPTNPPSSAANGTPVLRRLLDQHRWDPQRDQDFPGCPPMTSQERNLKTHIHRGIDLIPGKQTGKGL